MCENILLVALITNLVSLMIMNEETVELCWWEVLQDNLVLSIELIM